MKDKKRIAKNQRKIIEFRLKKSRLSAGERVKYGNVKARKSIAEFRWQVKPWFNNKQRDIID